jgi:hypothetical protein
LLKDLLNVRLIVLLNSWKELKIFISKDTTVPCIGVKGVDDVVKGFNVWLEGCILGIVLSLD